MCGLDCCISGCGKLADYIDTDFESLYLFYIKVRSFMTHHYEAFNSLPPSTSKSIQLVLATLLCIWGKYFTFFITLLTVIPAIKV